jgi:TolA-binding protein
MKIGTLFAAGFLAGTLAIGVSRTVAQEQIVPPTCRTDPELQKQLQSMAREIESIRLETMRTQSAALDTQDKIRAIYARLVIR